MRAGAAVRLRRFAWIVALPFVWTASTQAQRSETSPSARVAAARFVPFYGEDARDGGDVRAFELDRRPVTNAEYLAFVRSAPRWRRGEVPALFADASYLSHWGGALELGEAGPQQPVAHVSWFAARAYCAAHKSPAGPRAAHRRRGDRFPRFDVLAHQGRENPPGPFGERRKAH